MHGRTITYLAATVFLVAGVAAADDKPRAHRSDAAKSRQPARRSASGGSVRYHRTSNDRERRDQGAVSSARRSSSPVRRSDRSATADRARQPDRRSPGTDDRTRFRSPTATRRYDSRDTRNRASSGSIRHYRPGPGYSTHLPGHVPHHDVRVRRYPRYGTCITQLPTHRHEIIHHGHSYYFCDGVYYRRSYGDVYAVVRPPIGVRLTYLPEGYLSLVIGGRPYYRYENTYYVREVYNDDVTYVVVEPPDEVIVDYLPPDCQETNYRGRTYFVDIYEETAYAPVLVDGRLCYRLTNLDVDVEFDDGRIEIEIDD